VQCSLHRVEECELSRHADLGVHGEDSMNDCHGSRDLRWCRINRSDGEFVTVPAEGG